MAAGTALTVEFLGCGVSAAFGVADIAEYCFYDGDVTTANGGELVLSTGGLGDGFREFEAVEVSVSAIAFRHSSGILLDVHVIDLDGCTVVSLLGISACGEGEPPAE